MPRTLPPLILPSSSSSSSSSPPVPPPQLPAPLTTFYTQAASLLEQRLCERVAATIASVSVDTGGAALDWDNSLLVAVNEEESPLRYVLDELCEDLDCTDEQLAWAMTCIKVSLAHHALHVPIGSTGRRWSAGRTAACLDLAKALCIKFMLGVDGEAQTETAMDEDETFMVDLWARDLLTCILLQHPDAGSTYSGRILYSVPDRRL